MCALCGLPVRHSGAKQELQGETLHFCCTGCLNVFQILFNRPEGVPANFRETDLYRACIETGLIPRDEKDPVYQRAQIDLQDTKLPAAQILEEANHAQDVTLRIDGMWCTACGWLIEEVLNRTQGIVEAKVFFLSDMAQMKYLSSSLTPQDILGKIRSLGYHPSFFHETFETSEEKKHLLLRLGISSFLTANIMMISLALYMGFFEDLTPQGIGYLSYPLWVLATPVIFYGGFSIFRRALAGLRYWNLSMDTLISIGALAAYFYSVLQVIRGSLHVYFDTASMLITLVLLGRYVEARAKDRISRGMTELYRLANQKVRLWTMDKERWISADAVESGDEFLVMPGERVPVDGRIISDRAVVDESILTGESRPVRKEIGEEVMGGSLLLEGGLKLKASKRGHESSVKQMIQLMQEALSRKNPFELLSDKIMRGFVPGVLIIAGATAYYLGATGTSMEGALLRAIAVLVVACPCALGIASPLAKVAAIGAGRERGILIRDPSALEQAKDLDVMIFDKTGTMTQGKFSLQEVVTEIVHHEEALRQVASVEVHSDHFLAREIVRKASELCLEVERATDFRSFEGLGVRGRVQGKEVAVGNRQFMRIEGMNMPSELDKNGQISQTKGRTVVFFGWDGKVQGFLTFGDPLKEGSPKTVQELHKKNMDVWLISGDAETTTRAVATELGIRHFSGQVFPKDKVEVIKKLQNEGHRVGMVGDGINDAAALVQADVGLALGTRVNIAQEASDITLLTDNPNRILEVLGLSKLTMKIIRQNLAFAFLYNGLGIPLAVAGLLNPLIAVCAMFASSLSVIGNSLRIAKLSKVTSL